MFFKNFLFKQAIDILKSSAVVRINQFQGFKAFSSTSYYKMSQATNEEVAVEIDNVDTTVSLTDKPMSKRALKRLNFKETKEEKKRRVKERRAALQETRSVGFGDNVLNHTTYYFENGLRKVKPYWFEWTTSAKERWFKRTLYDVYSNEFCRVLQNENLDALISEGKIKVNGEVKDKNYILKNGDFLFHKRHRHEIAVVGEPIEIVADTDDYLAVNKPCSIPMHPCGKYRYNSLIIILLKEMQYQNLRSLYRLDRLTSGIVIFGKNFKSSKLLDGHIKNRTAEKTYLSRVVGKFPEGEITVDQPLNVLSRKIGIYCVDTKNGKESLTRFKLLSYNGKTSVVMCYPKTGRTHQIRLHLQYLGHPIINDPIYNDKRIWGETNGKNGVCEYTPEQVEDIFMKIHSRENWLMDEADFTAKDDDNQEASVVQNKGFEADEQKTDNEEDSQELDNKKIKLDASVNLIDSQKIVEEAAVENLESQNKNLATKTDVAVNSEYDENCAECKQDYKEPSPKDLVMYLHALSYKFGDFEFKTKMPKWADEDFDE